jgi:hypothetical protein
LQQVARQWCAKANVIEDGGAEINATFIRRIASLILIRIMARLVVVVVVVDRVAGRDWIIIIGSGKEHALNDRILEVIVSPAEEIKYEHEQYRVQSQRAK